MIIIHNNVPCLALRKFTLIFDKSTTPDPFSLSFIHKEIEAFEILYKNEKIYIQYFELLKLSIEFSNLEFGRYKILKKEIVQ